MLKVILPGSPFSVGGTAPGGMDTVAPESEVTKPPSFVLTVREFAPVTFGVVFVFVFVF